MKENFSADKKKGGFHMLFKTPGPLPPPLQYQEGHPIGAALFSLSVYLLCFS